MAVQDELEASRAAIAPLLLGRVARGEASAVKECIALYGGLVWAMARRLAPGTAVTAAQLGHCGVGLAQNPLMHES
jgi:hypothetical protein